MTELTAEKRAELRWLAEAVSAGHWWRIETLYELGDGIAGVDARFIAATGPAVVLSLLDALDAAEAKLTGGLTKEQVFDVVVDELAEAWVQGYEAALKNDCNAFRDPGAPFAENPYRKTTR